MRKEKKKQSLWLFFCPLTIWILTRIYGKKHIFNGSTWQESTKGFRVSASRGPQQPQQDSAPGGGPRRWRTRAPASKSTCTATASAVRWVMHVGPKSRARSQAHESQVPNAVFWAHCTRLGNPLQTFNPSRCHLLERGDSRVSLSGPFCRPVLYPYEPQSNS